MAEAKTDTPPEAPYKIDPAKATSFEIALAKTSLSPLQKTVIKERYITLLRNEYLRSLYISFFYHIMRFLVTVGSLIVPALLSIQYTTTSSSSTNPGNVTDPTSFPYKIYWSTWVISLLVTTSNGILSTYKIDKKYYLIHSTIQQLRSEGWQYLQLTGRYSGFYTPGAIPTHTNQYVFFCSIVEKIKMKEVEEEYYKFSDTNTSQVIHSPSKESTTSSESSSSEKATEKKNTAFIPPTPLNTIKEQKEKLPKELLNEISSSSSSEQKPAADIETGSSNEKETASVPMSTELRKVVIGDNGTV